MRISLHLDYSYRVLIYLATHPSRIVPAEEIASAYGVSLNHLQKVVGTLHRGGFITLKRGRAGGASLAKEPKEITLGAVARIAEPDFNMVECFDPKTNTCPIASVCGLKSPLVQATAAFLAVLDGYTLADVCKKGLTGYKNHFLPASSAAGV